MMIYTFKIAHITTPRMNRTSAFCS